MLKTQSVLDLLQQIVKAEPSLNSCLLVTTSGVLLASQQREDTAEAGADDKLRAMYAAKAWELTSEHGDSLGLSFEDSKIYVAPLDEYLLVVTSPRKSPWGALKEVCQKAQNSVKKSIKN